MDNKYIIQVPGDDHVAQWSEEKYNANKDALMKQYPDAQVSMVSQYSADDKVEDNDNFIIQVPGDDHVAQWDSRKFGANREKLMQDYPDAQISVSRPVDYWGPKLIEQQQALDDFEATDNAAFKQEYEDAMKRSTEFEKERARTRSTERNPELDFLDSNRERYMSVNKEYKDLQKSYYSNPLIKGYFDEKAIISGNANKDYTESAKNSTDREERKNFERAAKLQDDITKLYSQPIKQLEDNDLQTFLKDYKKGMGTTFSDKDFWTRGFSAIARNLDLRGVQKKVQEEQQALGRELDENDYDRILSPGEKAMLNSFRDLSMAQFERAENLPMAYTAGQGAAESLGFMAEFILSGSVSKGVGKALSKSNSSLAKWLGREMQTSVLDTTEKGARLMAERTAGMSSGRKFAYQYLTKPVGEAVSHTVLQPMTYRTISDNLTRVDDEGQLIGAGKAIMTGVLDSVIENWSESMGGAVENVLAAPFKLAGKGLDKAIGGIEIGQASIRDMARYFGDNRFTQFLKQTGFNGFIGEMGEEWLGNGARVLTGLMSKKDFKDFASLDSQLEMAASFGLMTGMSLIGNTRNMLVSAKQYDMLAERVKNRMVENGVSQQEIDDVFNKKYATSKDIAMAFMPYYQQMVGTGTQQEQKDALDMLKFMGQEAIIDEYKEVQKEQKRNDNEAAMNAKMNDQQWWFNTPDEQQMVKRYVDKNGVEGFVIGQTEDGRDIVNFSDGRKRFIGDSERENEQFDITESMPVKDYLDGIDVENSKQQEQVRMQTEEQQQMQDVRSSVQQGTQLNIGTVESPNMVAVMQTSDNGVIVMDANQQVSEIPWIKVADYIGKPIDVKTDQVIDDEGVKASMAIEDTRKKADAAAKSGQTIEKDGTTYRIMAIPSVDETEDGTVFNAWAVDEIGRTINIGLTNDDITGMLAQAESNQQMAGGATGADETQQPDAVQPAVTADEDGVLRDFRGNAVPLKADGSVDENTFWNNDHEAWARWKTEQLGDGGVYAANYIGKAIMRLQSGIAEEQKKIDSTTDFDIIGPAEQSISDINNRIAELETLTTQLTTQQQVSETAQQANVENTEAPADTYTPTEESPFSDISDEDLAYTVKSMEKDVDKLKEAIAKPIDLRDQKAKDKRSKAQADLAELEKALQEWKAENDARIAARPQVEGFSDMDAKLGNMVEEMGFEDQVAYHAAKSKYIWGDSDHGTKGLGSHLIATKGSKENERRNHISWIATKDKGGAYPEVVAERIFADLPDYVKEGHDPMEALDIILDVISSSTSPSDAVRKQYDMIVTAQRDLEQQEEEYAKHQYATEHGFANFEDYTTFNELIKSGEYYEDRFTDDEINEIYSLLAEEYESGTEGSTGTGVQGVVSGTAGQESGSDGGNQMGSQEEASEQRGGSDEGWPAQGGNNVVAGSAEAEPVSNQQGKSAADVELNGQLYNIADLEQQFRDDIEMLFNDNDIDAEIVGVKLIGSRIEGSPRTDSDLDLLVEYKGDYSEDSLFNLLNAEPFEINGIKLDINPITEGKSGTIEQFLKRNDGFKKEAQPADDTQDYEDFLQEQDKTTVMKTAKEQASKSIRKRSKKEKKGETEEVKPESGTVYGGNNTLVTKDRYEELKKKLRGKLNNLNAGFDPETFAIGCEMAAYHMEAGARSFVDFCKRMISDIGDAVRPYLKSFYNGARDLPGMEELSKLMDSYESVSSVDVNSINIDEEPEPTPTGTDGTDETEGTDSNETEEPSTKFKAGDKVVLDGKEMTVESINKDGSYNLVYDPTGFLPVYSMGIDESKLSSPATQEQLDKIQEMWDGLTPEEQKTVTEELQKEGDSIEQTMLDKLSNELGIIDSYGPSLSDATGSMRDEYYDADGKIKAELKNLSDEEIEQLITSRNYTLKQYANREKLSRENAVNPQIQDEQEHGVHMESMKEIPVNSAIGEVIKDKNTKTGEDIWVVKPSQRVGNDVFKSLRDAAKNNNGYWSTFKHGFLFKTEEDANNFNNSNIEGYEQTNEQREASTAAVVSKAGSVAQEADAVAADDAATEAQLQHVVDKIDDTLDAINEKLAILGTYPVDTKSKWDEQYEYLKSAEKIAVQDMNKLGKSLQIDLGLNKDFKPKAHANIAPAGGEISLRLPLDNGYSLYINLLVNPSDWYDSLVSKRIMWRVENPGATSFVTRYGNNNIEEPNVTYKQLLDNLRSGLRMYLPEQKTEITEVAKEISKKNKEKKQNSIPLSGDELLGDLFTSMQAEKNTPAPVENTLLAPEPDHHGYKVGDKVRYEYPGRKPQEVTITDFDEHDGHPILDTFGASWITEIGDWEYVKPIVNENTDSNEQRLDGRNAPDNGEVGAEERQEAERTDGRGMDRGNGTGSGNDEGRGGSSSGSDKDDVSKKAPAPKKNTHNNHQKKGEVVVPKSPSARFKANVEAIKVMRRLVDSEQNATKDDMAVLRQFTGWGGLGGVFKNVYSPEYTELTNLLTPEEFDNAVMSVNSAYFTPEYVVDSLWDIARQLGFDGGRILEGSAGIGNILAVMPKNISEASDITAVEIDGITGNILKLLYPDADVQIKGFQDVAITSGTVDLAITNVPFVTGLKVFDQLDKDLSNKFANIHDFCIAKNLRKLREGALGIFITTKGTLDSSNSKKLRSWITNEGGCDVIGAYRLNNETFEGTTVTSDIIVARKRIGGVKSAQAIDISNVELVRDAVYEDKNNAVYNYRTGEYTIPKVPVVMEYNGYFVEHPENMGGEMAFAFEKGDTFRPTSVGLYPSEKINQDKSLSKWVKGFNKEYSAKDVKKNDSENNTATEHVEGKEGQIYVDGSGNVCVLRGGIPVPLEGKQTRVKGYERKQVVADYDKLKEALQNVLDTQMGTEDDAELNKSLKQLNDSYDTFVKRYGRLNNNISLSWLKEDVDYASTSAIESFKEIEKDGKKEAVVGKTDVFRKRVLGVKAEPKPKNISDAVLVSISRNGKINVPYIAELLGMSEEKARQDILASRMAYENPQTGEIEPSYIYLSGNVREKYQYAVEMNRNGVYDSNVEALKKVIPADIPATLIDFSIGSDWIDAELYDRFCKEKYDVEIHHKCIGGKWMTDRVGDWEKRREKNRMAGVHSDTIDMDAPGSTLMLCAMNNTPFEFSKIEKHSDGTSTTIKDQKATDAAAVRVQEIRDEFKEWCRNLMYEDTELADRLAARYNETFNNYAPVVIGGEFIPQRFEGSVITMGGKPFELRPHQKNAVIRSTIEPVLLAHEVGTGKTFTLISAAMEMKRLGTAQKPMIVVQNATVGQFVTSAKELYPNAKILTVSDKDRTKEGRLQFYAKIKYNDWDMIIVPQSVFEMMPDSPERRIDFISEKIDEKMAALVAASENNIDSRQLSSMEKELSKLNADRDAIIDSIRNDKKGQLALNTAAVKAQKQLDRRQDAVDDFDKMGIDALLVDEAHAYKRLGFETAIKRGVKGVDKANSKRSAGVYMKLRSIFDRCGWRNVVFATGTPISNTAAEIWTFMKYLMKPDVMKANHIYNFDDFVRNFGNISQNFEHTTSGKVKDVTRFAAYNNVPELVRIWSSVSDTVRSIDADSGDGSKLKDKIPELEGGKAEDKFLEQTPSLIGIMNSVRAKLEAFEKMSGKEKQENSYIPLVMFGIAKRAAIDARLVDANAADEPGSKTNVAVKDILDDLKQTKDYNGTVAVFCDNYRRVEGGVESFNLFEDVKSKLIANGVPESQIVIMRADMSTKKKEQIFASVNSGDIRVIMGTTQTLGTGVNIQERLHMAVHIDAPIRPMDYTQRNGRILRQGNLHRAWNKTVKVIRYGVKDSLDVTAYQRLKTKASFIDSIMNGKKYMSNSMEDRTLEEEEEGMFDNPVAVLSGSQYAIELTKVERELRKYTGKKEQYRHDQIYIENQTRNNTNRIASIGNIIAKLNDVAVKFKEAFPDGKPKTVTLNGKKYVSNEELQKGIREFVSTRIKAITDEVNRNSWKYAVRTQAAEYDMDFDEIKVVASVMAGTKLPDQSGNRADISYRFYIPDIETSDNHNYFSASSIKNIVEQFTSNFATGIYFDGRINKLSDERERLMSDNAIMEQRRGKAFEFDDKIKELAQRADEVREAMKAELKANEEKYAAISTEKANLDDIRYDDEEDETSGDAEAMVSGEDETLSTDTDAKQWVVDELMAMLGDDVQIVSQEEADNELNGAEQMSKGQKRALETVSLAKEQDQAAVVSSAAGAKVLENLKGLKERFNNISNRPDIFIGNVANAIGAKKLGSNSEYATFETKNGKIVTIRLSGHNAKVSNFDNKNEDEGISIVISRKPNASLDNDGNAHIVEYYYNAIKLAKAEGKPLVDIISSIEQALYSGEYKDTTGLAEREEVNAPVEFMTAYHGTGADFEKFDNSHMGEGEGAQAHGYGAYVTFDKETGEGYAKKLANSDVVYDGLETYSSIIHQAEYVINTQYKGNVARAIKQERISYVLLPTPTSEFIMNSDESDWKVNEGSRILYTVEIPEDNGSNYLDEQKAIGEELRDRIAGILKDEGFKETDRREDIIEMSKYDKKAVIRSRQSGRDLYAELSDALGGDRQASEFLSENGFVGIKYVGIKDGPCAVVFNDNDIRIIDKTEFSRNDKTVYGYAKNGKIYLTKEGINPNTPIHEYTHLWAKAMQKYNQEGWNDIVKLLKNTPVWNDVVNDESYQNLKNDDAIASEVLSRISGKKNAEKMIAEAEKAIAEADGVLEKAKAISLRDRMKRALEKFWNWVGTNLFGMRFNSIDEVTDRVLWDLVSGTDLGENASDESEFSIMGAKGAGRLDRREETTRRMDDLNVAERMEAEGKDSLTIKRATGWERGADGKWRYESVTGKLRDWDGSKVNLPQIWEDKSLFIAYPELNDFAISTRKLSKKIAGYTEGKNIVMNESIINDKETMRSFIAHEIQHAIQDIEGFARGTNGFDSKVKNDTDAEKIVLLRHGITKGGMLFNSVYVDDVKKYIKSIENKAGVDNSLSESIPSIPNANDYEGWYNDKQYMADHDAYKKWESNVEEGTIRIATPEAMAEFESKVTPEQAESLKDLINRMLEWRQIEKEVQAEKESGKYNKNYYWLSAGEVEARNEQARKDMSEDERRNTLLSDTEDVSRDEQWINLYADERVKAAMRTKPAPEKTGIGYKVFFKGKDGKLYPPMVANQGGVDTPVGVWLDAEEGTKAPDSKTGRPHVKQGGKGTQGGSGTLAYRPGWHLGKIPYALQFNRKDENGNKTLFPKDFVWAEVEYAMDRNYQEEAMKEGMTASGKFQHSLAGLKKLPEDGYYEYRTNPNPATDPWIITGAMKVNKVLTKDEVDKLVRQAGREPQRVEGDEVRDRNNRKAVVEDGYSYATQCVERLNKMFPKAIPAKAIRLDMSAEELMKAIGVPDTEANRMYYYNDVQESKKNHKKTFGIHWPKHNGNPAIIVLTENINSFANAFEGFIHENMHEFFSVRRNQYIRIGDNTFGVQIDKWYKRLCKDIEYQYGIEVLNKKLNAIRKYKDEKKHEEFIIRHVSEQMANLTDDWLAGQGTYFGNFINDFKESIGYDEEKFERYDFGEDELGQRTGGLPGRWGDSVLRGGLASKSEAARQVADRLGVKVEFVSRDQMPEGHKWSMGVWQGGRILVCPANNPSAEETVKTVLHEAVGHEGLRRLVGKDYIHSFCMELYRLLPESRKAIVDIAARNRNWNIATAVEEHLAEEAQNFDMDDDYRETFFDKVRSVLRNVLSKIGINIPLSERDIRWLLYQNYYALHNNLKTEANRARLAHRLGFSESALKTRAEAQDVIRDRDVNGSMSAARLYNTWVSTLGSRLHETMVDQNDAVGKLVKALEKASGKAARSFENVMLALNQQSSKGYHDMQEWEKRFWKPLQEVVRNISEATGKSVDDIERYMMLKHGLERNIGFAKRDARSYYQNIHDIRVEAIKNDETLDTTLKEAKLKSEDAKLTRHLNDIDAGTDAVYNKYREKDYGGLTGIYSDYPSDLEPYDPRIESMEEYLERVIKEREPIYDNVVDMEAKAQEEVDAFEKDAGQAAVNELWSRTNAATKATLKHQYDHNMMSREQYEHVRDMFEYYIPLRGFSDKTAGDIYSYYTTATGNQFQAPVLAARGRTTKAGSPLGYIGAQASSGIAQDMKNDSKLALWYFVNNRAGNDLVTISDTWYQKKTDENGNVMTDADGHAIMEPVYPPFVEELTSEKAKQSYLAWENGMKALAKQGMAFHGVKEMNKQHLRYVINQTKDESNSHIITLKVGGQEKFMFINGNPRAAQAINNELNMDVEDSFQKIFGPLNRFFSNINTSMNPEFWISNFQRDIVFALMSVDVKEDNDYNKAYHKNLMKAVKAVKMNRALNDGKLGNGYLEDMYREFVDNGGVTGYTTIVDKDKWENEVRKFADENRSVLEKIEGGFDAVKSAKVFEGIAEMSDGIEQINRFCAFLTSREMGKDVRESIADAKELTINFNRKGSGKPITFDEAKKLRVNGKPLNALEQFFAVAISRLNRFGRQNIIFWNASVQAINAMAQLVKANPKKLTKWGMMMFAFGAINAALHAMLDDDDDYLDIPDYERHNNLLVGGNGYYFKWALPQEMRVLYGIGDMAVTFGMGRYPHKNLIEESLGMISAISPLDFQEGWIAAAPTWARPAVEVYANKDFKGSPIYKSNKYMTDAEKKATPNWNHAYQNTGKVFVNISRVLNAVTGGDEIKAGLINIHPEVIEHLAEGLTGGAGTTIEKTYRSTVGNLIGLLGEFGEKNGETPAIRNTPFLSRLFTITDERYRNSYVNDLYWYYNGMSDKVKHDIDGYMKAGNTEKAEKIMDSEDYEAMMIFNRYKKGIRAYDDILKVTNNRKERKQLTQEQDALKAEMLKEISNIGKE